jgi:flagellar biosynthesis protein
VADPKKRAVALKYEPTGGGAPKVVAKGRGAIAEKILELALVTVLSKLNVDQEIPPQLYAAVAAILAFLYKANQQPA